MKKRTFSTTLAFLLAFGSAAALPQGLVRPDNTITASAETSGDYEYAVLDDGTVEIRKCSDDGGNIVIPTTLDGKKVTRIGANAFANCSDAMSIKIPEGITAIGDSAFSNCDSLMEVTIPEGVTWIGSAAFSDCDELEKATLPESLKRVGSNAFYWCPKLLSITIPKGLTDIGARAFGYYYDNGYVHVPGFMIYGYSGSEGETYANDNEFFFLDMDHLPALTVIQGTDDKGNAIPLTGVTLTLMDQDGMAYENTNTDDEAPFAGVPDGMYMVTASKEGYAPYEYALIVRNGGLVEPFDIELHQYGDVTGDGVIDTSDWAMLKGSLQGIIKLDAYDELVADADGNGKKEVSDATTLKAKITGLIR